MVVICSTVRAQGVGPTFAFLEVPSSAKLAGLGGVNASLFNNDVNLFLVNPALLGPTNNMNASVNYAFYPANTGMSSISYAQEFNKAGLFGAGLHYFSYGVIDGYDQTGAATGPFKPNDFAFNISHSRAANNFRIGGTVKFVAANIVGYHSSALLFDVGGLFVHPTKDFTVGMVLSNFGFTIQKFTESQESDLPFNVQIGTSIKPEHMPIRFSITLNNLNQWDLMQPDEKNNGQSYWLDNTFRHVVFGAEFILSKNVNLLFGYNHLRRSELKLEQAGSFSGFAVGGLIKMKAFEFVYTFAGYHASGNTNTLTLTGKLSELIVKN